MPKSVVINDVKGTLLTVDEYNRIEIIETDEELLYFIPSTKKLNEEEINNNIEDMILKNMMKSEICKYYKMSRGWLNGRLKKIYNTYDLTEIRKSLGQL